MDLRHLIDINSVVFSLKANSKKQVLQDLVSEAVKGIDKIDSQDVFNHVIRRERLGSTGMGDGVAIPHASIPGLQGLRCVFSVLARPVAYDSMDDIDVDLVFLLLAPQTSGADHLKALAGVSRFFRNSGICSQIRAAKSAQAIYSLLLSDRSSFAA
jgi:PTS system nitrogen regulatory IIA component